MKFLSKILNAFNLTIFVFSLFISPIIVNATSNTVKIGTLNANSVNVRTGPGTNHSVIERLGLGENFIILGEKPNELGCSDVWFEIEYHGTKNGFLCSTFVDVNEVNIEEGDTRFPESYRTYISILKALYPEWSFEPVNTGLDFNDVIEGQNALGKSLLWDSNGSRDGWKHLAGYDYINNTFRNDYPGGGVNWFAASDEVIAYYLDPRNFLNERRIFMFETQSFNSEYHTLEGVSRMLEPTFMSGSPNREQDDIDRGITYAEIFMEAAHTHNINPYFLAARVIQEVGVNRTTIVSGTVEGFEGYYNFYNINATGPEHLIITNGLTRAVNEGWNSEYNAIIGGARFIANSYIAGGQDTHYTQKFNVVRPNYFTHQYMQNIEAPFHESSRVYNNYRNNNLLDKSFVFKIPVFNNMPTRTELPPIGNPNNYLSGILINGEQILGFNPDKTEYTINVPVNTTSVILGATSIVSTASISGRGTLELEDEVTIKNIVVTAENQTKRTYKLNIMKTGDKEININYIMKNSGIEYDDKHIKDISLQIKTNQIIEKIRNQHSDVSVAIHDINNNIKNNQNIGTGDRVTITLGNETKTYTVIVKGDTTGSGDVTILDLLRVQRIILNTSSLSEVFVKAADVNGDGRVTIVDLLRIQKHILGESSIN